MLLAIIMKSVGVKSDQAKYQILKKAIEVE